MSAEKPNLIMSNPTSKCPDSQLSPAASGFSRARAVKNLLMLALSLMLMFTSYQGLSLIQSSFNTYEGLGTAGLTVNYVALVVSSLTVTPLIIGRLGPKQTMMAALIGYLVYMCANLYPHWGTIIPASVLLGMCSAPLWASMSMYIVRLADLYTKASGAEGDRGKQRVTAIFFGAFYTVLTTSNVWGNLISFLAFSGSENKVWNGTASGGNLSCGHQFCSGAPRTDGESQTGRPSLFQYYVMMACFITTVVLSILVMLFLVDRTDRDSDKRRFSLAELQGNLRAMLTQMTDARQLLLVILTANIGLSQSFLSSDFTEGFVACSSGIAAVGRVMMCYGAGLILSGLVFGQVAGLVGSSPVLVFAACVQLTLESLALFWQVTAEPAWLLYAFAFAWGCVASVWGSQLRAVYSDFFADQTATAFSVYSFLSSVGNILGFSYNKLLCIEQKLYVMLAVVSTGGATFVISVILNWRMRAANRVPPI